MAIVTGAANGIGLAIAKALLKSGAKVGLLDIAEGDLTKSCDELREQGYGSDCVLGVKCDVSNKDELVKAFHIVRDKFGYISTVVNNAGRMNELDWEKTLQINLHAVIAGTMEAIEMMSTSKGGQGGVVVNMASIAGISGQCGMPIYTATKAGVIGYTRSMELAKFTHGVRVNCICPVMTDTAMNPKEVTESAMGKIAMEKQGGEMMSPEYVAEGVMKLVTDDSLYGQALRAHPNGYIVHDYSKDRALGITADEILTCMTPS